MNVLDRLAGGARERVAEAKARKSLSELAAEAKELPRGDFAFEKALGKEGLSFICECKKASPSKGLIAPDFPYLEIAGE
ncbi:MAG: indole-3-glycerol-phosphate synthase TrpC, partial [Selenomonas sp.]|nr:indole-3-glycerol-phosphate synthase TrpC [Selenomonas sp.]